MARMKRLARRTRPAYGQSDDDDTDEDGEYSDDDVPLCLCGGIYRCAEFAVLKERLAGAAAKCSECALDGDGDGDDGAPAFVCLECGNLGCAGFAAHGGEPEGHAVCHFRLTGHSVVFRSDNPISCWCYACLASPQVGSNHVLFVLQKLADRGFVSEEFLFRGEKAEDFVKKPSFVGDEMADEFVCGKYFLGDEDSDEFVSDDEFRRYFMKNNFVGDEIVVGQGDDWKGYVVRGLVNLGNTCYFNSVLQNLLVIGNLRHYFSTLGWWYIGPITSAFRELFYETSLGRDSELSLEPSDLFNCICCYCPQFVGDEQHDSHEMLMCLLGVLKDEELDYWYNMNQPTLVDSVFGGLLLDTINCRKCGITNKVGAPFLDLSLSIPTKNRNTQKSQASQNKSGRVGTHVAAESSGYDVGVSSSTEASCLESTSVCEPAGAVKDDESLDCGLSDPESVVSCMELGLGENQPSDGRDAIESPQITFLPGSEVPIDKAELKAIETENPLDVNESEVLVNQVLHDARTAEHLEESEVSSVLNVPTETMENLGGGNFTVEVEEGTSLNSCLALFTTSELLPDKNWHCENCSKIFLQQSAKYRNDLNSILQKKASSQPEKCHVADGLLDSNQTGEEIDNGVNATQSQLVQLEELGFDSTYDHDQLKVEKDLYFINPLRIIPAQLADDYYNSQTLDPSTLEKDGEKLEFVSDEVAKTCLVDVKIINDATKQLLIEKAPPVLILHLKRFFRDESGHLRKINGHVSLSEVLDLGPYLDESSVERNPCLYRLTGVVEHVGTTLEEGHYIAYVRGNQLNWGTESAIFKWFFTSDTEVYESSLPAVLNSEAYILFYAKC